MIARTNRFHGHNSLRFVYQQGHTVRGPLLGLKAVRNGRRQSYRCAVVVSKKISKLAVRRNRLRRRIYEIIRLQEPNLGSMDIVITVYDQKAMTLTSQELATAIQKLLTQLKAPPLSPKK